MLQNIKFLYEVYKEIKDKPKEKIFLLNIVRNEAKLNNDLITVIRRSDPNDVAEKMPDLYKQLNTTSFDLFSSLGKSPAEVFSAKQEPTYAQLEKLDVGRNTREYYKGRSEIELYEFYIRKCKLLVSLTEANCIAEANVVLKSRVNNIEYATHALINKLT
jgi:hypothetical protein